MIRVRTHDSTGRVLGWGESPFRTPAGAGETDAQLGAADATDRQTLNTVGPHHCKVVAGRIAEMTPAEKAASDLDRIPQDEQRARAVKADVRSIADGSWAGTTPQALRALARAVAFMIRHL